MEYKWKLRYFSWDENRFQSESVFLPTSSFLLTYFISFGRWFWLKGNHCETWEHRNSLPWEQSSACIWSFSVNCIQVRCFGKLIGRVAEKGANVLNWNFILGRNKWWIFLFITKGLSSMIVGPGTNETHKLLLINNTSFLLLLSTL